MPFTKSKHVIQLSDLVWAARGGGERLPARLERQIGRYFGADLAQVRIHRHAAVSAFNARAFAAGTELFFAPECWNPESPEGLTLLGHELAHVIQQRFIPRVDGAPTDRVQLLHCAALEAQADRAGEEIARVFADHAELPEGAGREVLGLRDDAVALHLTEPRYVQMQEKGVLGGFVLGGPALPPAAPAVGVVIFRQTATTNEVHRTRDLALDRARLKHSVGGKAQRTYYSNALHQTLTLGQGKSLRFMMDRALNPVEAYGRYYDFSGKLIVEHTDDANCRLIEITATNAINTSFRRWTVLPHFHMATYVGQEYAAPLVNTDQVNAAPPGYTLAVEPGGHHIYYLTAAAPAVMNHATPAFNNAFAAGAQAVFTLVWNW